MTTIVPLPMTTGERLLLLGAGMVIDVLDSFHSRLASLKGFKIGTTFSTPSSVSSA